MIIDNRKADRPASQSAKIEITFQNDYTTKISPVKEEDYYISVPVSVHNEGIRALATLANITAIIASEEDSYIDAKSLRALLGLSQKGDK